MGEETKIQWTHHTFNPWIGCAKIAAECTNCYAAVQTFARVQRGKGRELWGPRGERHVTSDGNWRAPLKWNRQAQVAGERHRVFCASMADVFEDRPDLVGPRSHLFDLIRCTPHLDWLLLTKRPQNADRLWSQAQYDWFNGADSLGPTWAPNVWLGTSAGSQKTADEFLPHLVRVPARVRFVSAEPLLGSTSLAPWLHLIDWVIIGGESGPGARPFNVEWARWLQQQCIQAKVPTFIKQMGARPVDGDPEPSGRFRTHNGKRQYELIAKRWPTTDSKGGNIDDFPPELRVREFPRVAGEA